MSESYDAFLGGRVHAYQPRNGFRAGTDTVLLAASVPAQSGQSVLELGAGSGVGLLCLGAMIDDLSLFGVEIDEESAARARRNLAEAGLKGEIAFGDIFSSGHALLKAQYDHVFCNPPFFAQDKHTAPRDPARQNAHIAEVPVASWVQAGLKRVRAKGSFTIIFPSEGLSDILCAIPKTDAVSILPIITKSGQNPKRVIVQIRTQKRAPLRLLAPLVLDDRIDEVSSVGDSLALGDTRISV